MPSSSPRHSISPSMAGIYIHIPFCRQACSYCNFHFSVSRRQQGVLVESLLKEIRMSCDFFDQQSPAGEAIPLNTIYVGGGTPSLLPVSDIIRIFEALSAHYAFDHNTEISLEANPDDLSREKLKALRQTPVNRLSIGVQSFHLPDLRYMNRLHTPQQAVGSLHEAMAAGFDNLTVDLIYGTPTLSDALWEENLMQLIGLGIPHISAYALTVEEKTPLHYLIRKGRAAPVEDEQTARQYRMMLPLMESRGYAHYEVSSFGLPGRFSRHNLAYWTGRPYLGIGPSAHSYKPGFRCWNIANTTAYIRDIGQGVLPRQSEMLTAAQSFDEYLMTSLRTMWGCDLDRVEALWGKTRREALEKEAARHIAGGLMERRADHLVLNSQGMLFADGIAADMFWVS